MSVERRRTVAAGYDELAPRYGDWIANIRGEPWARFAGELDERLPAGARVLDLGSGNGAKSKQLAERFDVVGVEISEKQILRARVEAPTATFVPGDFAELEFRAGSFDAVVALYSVIHVPRDGHGELFGRIRGWLRPGGLFLASLSAVGGPDRTENWLGVDMFFSGWDAETNRCLVREAGFELLVDEVIPMWEPEPNGAVAFLWVLARA